jgi:hypothetical protein
MMQVIVNQSCETTLPIVIKNNATTQQFKAVRLLYFVGQSDQNLLMGKHKIAVT